MEETNCTHPEQVKNPHSLVLEEHVKIALKAQCGDDAVLRSWKVQDFTNKGDNYACVVSSVMVSYLKQEEIKWTSFVVKLNPCRPMSAMHELLLVLFNKEAKLYTQILPELNNHLEKVGASRLKVPKCYFTYLETGNEIIYLEDLRDQGFKMGDRKTGFDVPHLLIVMKEIAKFHAASVLFKKNKTPEELVTEYPYFQEFLYCSNIANNPEMVKYCNSIIENASKIIASDEKYAEVAEKVKKIKFFEDGIETLTINPPFAVITHGDCWTNNFLFKYDENGSPIDVRLLDLQLTRVASPCLDLNSLLYSSVAGDIRKNHLDTILRTYLSSFDGILACNNQKPIYSFEEFKIEFRGKNMFGLLRALFLIPLMVVSSEDAMHLSDMNDENMENFLNEQDQVLKKQIKSNPLLRSRVFDMLDEMIENGVI